jgi:hypothetical protein
MPLPHKPHRLCIIGDSQLGSLQTAMQTGLTAAPDGVSVEFWGATGPDFRQIHWGDGAIRASGAAKVTAQKINAAGRDHIAPEDFDTVIFFGARLRVAEFFGPYLDWAHTHGNLPSKAVLYTSAKEFVWETRAYRMAHTLAQSGCDVIYVPGPFYTADILDQTVKNRFFHAYPGARFGTGAQRDVLWSTLEAVSADLNISLIRQPEDTVTQGVLTDVSFACEHAVENGDVGHKSAAFAARWMQEVWPHFQQKAKAA